MNIETKDEVIEELWDIKNQFAASSGGNMGDLVKKANAIAKQKGFQDYSVNQTNQKIQAGVSKK